MVKKKIKIPEALKNLAEYCEEDALERLSKLLNATVSFPSQNEQKHQKKILKALSDPTRLNILRLLKLRAMCVCELMTALDIPQPLISHHLRILRDCGIVDDRKVGKFIFYELHSKSALKMLDALDKLTEEKG